MACDDEITHIHVFKMKLLWWHAQLLTYFHFWLGSSVNHHLFCIYIYENKIELCEFLLFRICLTLKCNLHSESFRRNLGESCCKQSCILWLLDNCLQSQCHIFLYLCSPFFFFLCMCSWMQIACYTLRFFLAQQQA